MVLKADSAQLEKNVFFPILHAPSLNIPLSLLCSESAGNRESGKSLGKVRPAYLGRFST